MDKQSPTSHSKQQGMQKLVIGLLLVAVAAVVLLLPNLVNEPWIAGPSASTPVADKTAVSPSTAAEKTKYRQDSQVTLAQIIAVRDRLNKQSVERWADFEFRQAMALIEKGDEQYGYGNYRESLDSYQQSLAQLKSLEELGQQTLTRALADGLAAIENAAQTDISIATAAASLAMAIAPDDKQSQQIEQRAAVLPDVIEQLQNADKLLAAKQLNEAKGAYQKAVTLDPQHILAAAALSSTKQAIVEERFRNAMSQGFSALDKDNFAAANQAFKKAGTVYANHPSVAQALSQVKTRQSQILVNRKMVQASGHENSEQWQQALDIYQSLLATDPSLTAAKVRTIRVKVRAQLDSQINKILADPLKLVSPSLYDSGQRLLKDARGITKPGPVLTQQIADLNKTLRQSRNSIDVVLQSDSLTDVTLFRVKKLGAFKQTSVLLRPGRYIAAGKRLGYRDVRVEFTITGEPMPDPILVSCSEAI
jgi:tetratricopeptide (TPR) repeat protein